MDKLKELKKRYPNIKEVGVLDEEELIMEAQDCGEKSYCCFFCKNRNFVFELQSPKNGFPLFICRNCLNKAKMFKHEILRLLNE